MPFGVEKVALLGAAGGAGGSEITGGTRNDSMGDGYLYETFTASGTLTVSADMTIDMLVVGGGGGWSYGDAAGALYTGCGGGGGVSYGTAFDVTAGDYTVTIGALGTNGPSASQAGTNGGLTSITIGGVLLSGAGGGFGGWGGTYYAGGGNQGSTASSATSPNRGSGGGGGGGGIWPYNAGSTGGAAGLKTQGGSPSTGTWQVYDGGVGAGSGYSSYAGGGGGAGHSSAGGIIGQGYQGIAWNSFPTATTYYGQGGSGGADTTTPNNYAAILGTYGRGSSRQYRPGNAGVLIARWAV